MRHEKRVATDRGRCLAVLAVVTPLGLFTKFYSGPGSSWVASQAGGFLYVVFWVFVVLALFPRLSRLGVTLAVAIATSALEFVQLWHPAFLERIRASFLGHAVLGSTFAWSDFPYYAVGALAAYAAARTIAPVGRRALQTRESGLRSPGGTTARRLGIVLAVVATLFGGTVVHGTL